MEKGQELLEKILADNSQIGIDPRVGIDFQRDVSQEDFIEVGRLVLPYTDNLHFTSHTAHCDGKTHYRLWLNKPKIDPVQCYADWGSQKDIALVEMRNLRSMDGTDRDSYIFDAISGIQNWNWEKLRPDTHPNLLYGQMAMLKRASKSIVEPQFKSCFERDRLPVSDEVRIYSIPKPKVWMPPKFF